LPNPKVFTYVYTTTPDTVGIWSTFFLNSGTGCPVTSCTLKAVGCTNAYVAGQLTITGTAPIGGTPWTVKAYKNVVYGCTETICI